MADSEADELKGRGTGSQLIAPFWIEIIVNRLTGETSNVKSLSIQHQSSFGTNRAQQGFSGYKMVEGHGAGVGLETNQTSHQTIIDFERLLVGASGNSGSKLGRID